MDTVKVLICAYILWWVMTAADAPMGISVAVALAVALVGMRVSIFCQVLRGEYKVDRHMLFYGSSFL